MLQVVCFFAWLGVCALISWLTAFQLPDGYGNALLLVQLAGAAISTAFMANGLPVAIDPTTDVVISGRTSDDPNRVVHWPRRKGIRRAAIGAIVYAVATIGGCVLDRELGLSPRYATELQWTVRTWSIQARPALDPCLATLWTPDAMTCTLRYRVTLTDDGARLALRTATCPEPRVAACVRQGLADGVVAIAARQRASLAFGGPVGVTVTLDDLRGTGPPPPAERAP